MKLEQHLITAVEVCTSRLVESHMYAFLSFFWWLVRVTLVVAFGFCPKIFGGGGNLQIVILLEKECKFSGTDNMGTLKC